MSSSRRCQRWSQSRACLACQKRKSRCKPSDDGAGPCSYCARTGKTCSFASPPDRTRLTRKNLDAVELRCAQLHSLLRSLHPDLDIEGAIAKLPVDGSISQDPGLLASSFHEDGQSPASERVGPVHEFEWNEECTTTDPGPPSDEAGLGSKDGMGTFNSIDSGYLGSSSGSNLLQEIASMLPELANSSSPSDTHGKSPGKTRRRQESFDPPNLAFSAMTGYMVDAYFLFYNVSYPVLHEASFRRKAASQTLRKGPSSWNVIYFLVLAIGHWVSTSDAHHVRSTYYAAARSSLSIHMLESGTLETVQALLLMGNYLQKMDRPNTGYNFIGIAYRMALGLGLHRESHDAEDTISHERQRQLFWILYCFDSGFNITTGRPPNTSEGVIDTRIPRNIEDKDLEPMAPVPEEANKPTVLSSIIAHSNLAKIANSLYFEYLVAKTANTKVEYQVAEALDRSLARWRQNLPGYFVSDDVPMWFIGSRCVVLWKEQNLRILLWRGSKQHHSFLPSKTDAETRCLQAAMQSIRDVSTFCNNHPDILHQGLAWYATYFLFQAALIIESSYLEKKSQDQVDDDMAAWREVASEALDCLRALSQSQKSKSTQRCLEVLDLIHKRTGDLGPLLPEATATQQPPGTSVGRSERIDSDLNHPNGDYADALDGFGLGDDVLDPTMRMILDNTRWGFLDNAPMDVMLNDFIYPTF